MIDKKEITSVLRLILDNIGDPQQLDSHPWTDSLFVGSYAAQKSPRDSQPKGYQLLAALATLFQETMPSAPPRRGKRLDTAWGQFGILAALYFAPFEFSSPRPATLRDAWGRIDYSIYQFVFEQGRREATQSEVEAYQLISAEPDIAPTSTISDWHVKGLEKLAQALITKEQILSAQLDQPSPLLEPDAVVNFPNVPPPNERLTQLKLQIKTFQIWYQKNTRRFWLGFSAVLLIFLGWRAGRIFMLYRAVKQDVSQLQEMISPDDISLEKIAEIGPMLTKTRRDVVALRRNARPFVWVGPLFGWLPVYGGDLAEANDLLNMAAGLVIAGETGYQSAAPLLEQLGTEGQRPSIPEMLELFTVITPQLKTAQEATEDALAAYAKIDASRLSDKTKPLFDKVDPFIPLLGDGMVALNSLPKMLGASQFGPQTYLVLLQNEDELRATGGFITAVGTVTIDQGEILAFKVDDSYALDDFSKIYPAPPWQLFNYMNSSMWLLRDSNWSPDFPTTAFWAEFFYTYASAHPVDGVIAIDQEAIRFLLKGMGPIKLEGYADPVTAENVMDFIRYAKNESDEAKCGDLDPALRSQCKGFLRPLADAIFEKILGGDSLPWMDLTLNMMQALDERHILIQMDDPAITALLANRGWDGALRPHSGDFLMVVDSNVGFNKANVAVESRLEYSVDLTDFENIRSTLNVVHHNTSAANPEIFCEHTPPWDEFWTYEELIAKCYWNYLRVYTLAESELIAATPHEIPSEQMVRQETVPAQVDELTNEGVVIENPAGLRTFGTMTLVPLGDEIQTSFEFTLPEQVLHQTDRDKATYTLHIQKQPGTRAVPIVINVIFPTGYQLDFANISGTVDQSVWQLETTLQTDLDLAIRFTHP